MAYFFVEGSRTSCATIVVGISSKFLDRDNYKNTPFKTIIGIWRSRKLTGNDPLICVRCHIEMEFWFARYGPDKRVLNHFGLEKSDRIPTEQFALKSA